MENEKTIYLKWLVDQYKTTLQRIADIASEDYDSEECQIARAVLALIEWREKHADGIFLATQK